MNNAINWNKLLESNRVKELGIPWSDAEKHAVFILKVPAEYVRQGCLTQEDYQTAVGKREETEKKTGKVALIHLKKSQLMALCLKQGINVTEDAPRTVLVDALLQAGSPKSIPAEEVPAE